MSEKLAEARSAYERSVTIYDEARRVVDNIKFPVDPESLRAHLTMFAEDIANKENAQLREKLAAVRGIFLEWTEGDSIGEWCHECETEGFIGKLQHSQSCRVGRALAIIDGTDALKEGI